jgi:hypothetical protein
LGGDLDKLPGNHLKLLGNIHIADDGVEQQCLERQLAVSPDNGVDRQVADGDLPAQELGDAFRQCTNGDALHTVSREHAGQFDDGILGQIGDAALVGYVNRFPVQVTVSEDALDDLQRPHCSQGQIPQGWSCFLQRL